MTSLAFPALRALADGRFHSGVDIARALGRSRASVCEALKRAPELGVEVFRVRGRGYRLVDPIEFLDAGRIRGAMGKAASRIRVEVVDEIDSTSSRLMALGAAGEPGGLCLAAEWQGAGRGRRGRSWVSSVGGSLTFSVLWRFERGAGHLAGLSLAVGAAVATALADCGVANARVKWPNDVVVDLRKIAGILVETSGEIQGPSLAVVGIGVNYRLAAPVVDRIDQPVIDVAQCVSPLPSRNALLGAILMRLADALAAFEQHGFASARDAWRALHAYQGRAVRVLAGNQAPFEGEVVDVAADGALLVSTAKGVVALTSAEISLRPAAKAAA